MIYYDIIYYNILIQYTIDITARRSADHGGENLHVTIWMRGSASKFRSTNKNINIYIYIYIYILCTECRSFELMSKFPGLTARKSPD